MVNIRNSIRSVHDWNNPTSLKSDMSKEEFSVDGRSFSFRPHNLFGKLAKTFMPLYSTINAINEGDGVAIRTLVWDMGLVAAYTGTGYAIYRGIESFL